MLRLRYILPSILLISVALVYFLVRVDNSYSKKPKGWETSHFVWNFGMISAADKGLTQTPEAYFSNKPTFDKKAYANLKPGDIVWVQCRFIPQFCQQVLPSLKNPIVLLIADGDESFPSDCGPDFDVEPLLNNKNIIHVFAQNNDYSGPSTKVSYLPIGIDYHTVAYKSGQVNWGEKGSVHNQEAFLMDLLKRLKPTSERKKGAFVDFQYSDSIRTGQFKRYLQFGEDRQSIFNQLLPTGVIDYGAKMRRYALWETKGNYAFSISPHGNGLDCHRTWEDLILGCIVIVKTSSLDPLYEGLPVVIVKDWSEVTSANMDIWLAQYGDAFTNPTYREKLTTLYWLSKIRSFAQPYKK